MDDGNNSFFLDDDDPVMDDLFFEALKAADSLMVPVATTNATTVQPYQQVSSNSSAGQSTQTQKQKNLFEAFGLVPSHGPSEVQGKKKKKLEKNDLRTAVKPLVLKKLEPMDDECHFILDEEPSIRHSVDLEAYKTWIYPTNYEFRDYQFNVVQRALFCNTLVALPTGLGKTFIASVLMFNYYRWFPNGKVIFMAPTKPLVNQQVDACFRVTGLPPDETAELTGMTASHNRRGIWESKRVYFVESMKFWYPLNHATQVFFITPHVLQNDLESGCCSPDHIVLIVVDEAHRATGNYAYVEVMRKLTQENANFRVVALTATPGSDIKSVSQVVNNLRISRIEIRTEDSMDIIPFIHKRILDLVVVPVSEAIKNISNCYAAIMNVFLKRLNDQKVYYEKDPLNVTSYALLMSRERFRVNNHGPGSRPPAVAGYIEGTYGIAMTLAQAYALLIQHGIRTFYGQLEKFRAESLAKGMKASKASRELLYHPQFKYLMDHIPSLMNYSSFSSHLKMDKLVDVVLDHFVSHQRDAPDEQTRVIIFSQYRDSVEEIVTMLNRHNPIIRVMSFVGQSTGTKGKKGFTQKDQLEVISRFQSGNYNVLVSTSIGEEGLDIGQVDLIVCYDSQNSPIRMLQRMGRTGRKRRGRVVLLLTQGKEEEAYKKAQTQYKSVQNAITNGQGSKLKMFSPSYDVLPQESKPDCVKMSLDIPVFETSRSSKKKSESKSAMTSSRRNQSIKLEVPSANASLLLTSKEQEHFNNKYRTLPDENAKLSLSSYTYRQVMPLPLVHLPRTGRCLEFCSLISSMESIISEEESHVQSLPDRQLVSSQSPFHNSTPKPQNKRKSIIFTLHDSECRKEVSDSQYQSSPLQIYSGVERIKSPAPAIELTEQEIAEKKLCHISSPMTSNRPRLNHISLSSCSVDLQYCASPQIDVINSIDFCQSESLFVAGSTASASRVHQNEFLGTLNDHEAHEEKDFRCKSNDMSSRTATSEKISRQVLFSTCPTPIKADSPSLDAAGDSELNYFGVDSVNLPRSRRCNLQQTVVQPSSISFSSNDELKDVLKGSSSYYNQAKSFIKSDRRKRLVVLDSSSSATRPLAVAQNSPEPARKSVLFSESSPRVMEVGSCASRLPESERDTQGFIRVPKRTPLLERLEKRKQLRRPAPKMRCTPVIVPRRHQSRPQRSTKKTLTKKSVTVNPFMDLDARLSETPFPVSSDTDDDGLDENLTGFIADSCTQPDPNLGMTQVYHKSLLSPDMTGLGDRPIRPGRYQFRHVQHGGYSAQDTPYSGPWFKDSDTPGSLADFIVDEDDEELFTALEEVKEDEENIIDTDQCAYESESPSKTSLRQLQDLLDVSESESDT